MNQKVSDLESIKSIGLFFTPWLILIVASFFISANSKYANIKWALYIAIPFISISILTINRILRLHKVILIGLDIFIFNSLLLIIVKLEIIKSQYFLISYFSNYEFYLTIIFFLITILITIGIESWEIKSDLFKWYPILILIGALAWIAVLDLNNWLYFSRLLFSFEFNELAVSIFTIILINVYLKNIRHTSVAQSNKMKPFSAIIFAFDVFALLLFFLLSFRYDSLFIGSSSHHWEIYAGAIRGLQNGGVLLWNNPSQYGLLNILIASLFVKSSAYQAFYLFQSLLLFTTSSLLYIAVRINFARNLYTQLISAVIIALSIFCSDPSLIGPYVAPSTSVVRFFWVYVFLITIWLKPDPSKFQALLLAIIWPLSCLWSIESAFYCSSIIFFILTTLWFRTKIQPNGSNYVYLYSKILITSFIFFLASFTGAYKIIYKIYPDWMGLYEFAIGYSTNHNQLNFPLIGPLLIPALLFSITCILLKNEIDLFSKSSHFSIPLAGTLGCLWSVTSYYIGRPSHYNITSLLPIFITAFIFIIPVINYRKHMQVSALARLIITPLLFLLLITLSSPIFYKTALNSNFFAQNIEERLLKSDSELEKLLSSLVRLKNIKFSFFWVDSSPPIFSGQLSKLNNQTWIPIPNSLLSPLPRERRLVYLNRHFCGLSDPTGALVLKNTDESSVITMEFVNDLSYYFDSIQKIQSHKYEILIFEDFNFDLCH